jgi:quercetin dioxygenase-like cupin family protein
MGMSGSSSVVSRQPATRCQAIQNSKGSEISVYSVFSFSYDERSHEPIGGDDVSGTIRRVSEHPLKTSFDATPSDAVLRAEDGWVDMDVRWLLTRDTVGTEHSVFGITVFPPGSKHDIHRHPNAEEFEYLVSGHGIARVGDADVELGPGEVVFVPTNDYHGFENTGDEPVFMIWGYAGAASLDEAGYIRYVDDHPA